MSEATKSAAGLIEAEPQKIQTQNGVRALASRDIFANAHEVIIEHQGAYYRLRSTKKGKLILTK